MEKRIPHSFSQRTIKLSLLAILILAGGILLSAFHYHEDGVIFDDCPACRYQDSGVTTVSVETGASISPILLTDREIIVEFEIAYTTVSRPFKTLPNAPPESKKV